MSAKTERIVSDLTKLIKNGSNKKTTPYDSTATVVRVEDGVAWVHFDGGETETPAALTIDAKPGDEVKVRVSGGQAWLMGNGSAPPTDDTTALLAKSAANSAQQFAIVAKDAAENALSSAESASSAAAQAVQDAATANTAAGEAQTSANNANEYASRALGGLSTVQTVVETLNWIAAHGTMTLTSDTALDPTHVYFVLDTNGDYVVNNTHYSIVTEPVLADISTYYELSVDESLNNYVATHVALDSDGLWIIPETGGYKILIATGSGSTYTQAGTYIIDSNGDILASFGTSVKLGVSGQSQFELDSDSIIGTNSDSIPFFLVDMNGGTATVDHSFTAFKKQTSYYAKNDYITRETESTRIFGDEGGIDFRVLCSELSLGIVSPSYYSIDYANPNNSVSASGLLDLTDAHWEITSSGFNLYGGEIIFNEEETEEAQLTVSLKINNSLYTQYKATLVVLIQVQYNASTRMLKTTVTNYFSDPNGTPSGQGTPEIRHSLDTDWYCYYTTETKAPSFIFGNRLNDRGVGPYSSIFGESLYATGSHQMVIGRFNKNDPNALFVVGNGTEDSDRKNAFSVSSTGNLKSSGEITDGSGNKISGKVDMGEPYLHLDTVASQIDSDFYDAIDELNWEDDVFIEDEVAEADPG